jgi:hypothetical protein
MGAKVGGGGGTMIGNARFAVGEVPGGGIGEGAGLGVGMGMGAAVIVPLVLALAAQQLSASV